MGRKMASIEASSLSPSVMTWFGQELETRGIDAMIYTRYILSILQQEDPNDMEHWEAKFFPPSKKQPSPAACHHEPSPPPTTSSSPAAGSRGRMSGGKGRRASDKKKGVTPDELKKLAAIECLLSVSDEESGIENLVEELLLKLKEQEALKEAASATVLCSCQLTESSSESCDSGTEDPAERYYAAFPALSTQTESVNQPPPKLSPAKGVWANRPPGNWSDEHDSGSSSRDSSGERREVAGEAGDNVTTRRSRHNSAKRQLLATNTDENAKKALTAIEKAKYAIQPIGGKRRKGPWSKGSYLNTEDADSDKENSRHRINRGQHRDLWDRMKSPRSSSWSGGLEPKFVVPRLKSRVVSPSGSKMRMGGEELSSPTWRDLAFPYDEMIGEKTSISSMIRELLERKWRSVDLENQAWYTDPIEFLWPRSPSLSQRLYKRQSSLPDVSSINLSKIFEESESDHDEGFYGVGEEHQSAGLNVIAMLVGQDAKERWSLPSIKNEEVWQLSPGPTLHLEEEEIDNNNEKKQQCKTFSISTDDRSQKEQLYELLTGCKNCSQLQERPDITFGASHKTNSAFVPRPRDPVGSAWDPPELPPPPPRRDPLYRRGSSGRVADDSNAPCIPASTENQVPDDRPGSCDLNLQHLFTSAGLPSATAAGESSDFGGSFLLEQEQQSSIASSSSSSSSTYHLFHRHDNPYSLPIDTNSSVHSNTTGSCLNSINSDYSVFTTQTLPVVVVASGRDLGIHSETAAHEDEHTVPKATFHWTLDDYSSSYQEDAGESLHSPFYKESEESALEFEESIVTTSAARKRLNFSDDEEEEVLRYSTPPNGQFSWSTGGADTSVDSIASPPMQHLFLTGEGVEERRGRGPSLSSDDGDAGEQRPLIPADPHIDSAELRLNLDFILDNSSDEEVPDLESSEISGPEANLQFENEAASLELDQDVFEDLAEDLKLNLDFIDEEDDHLGDLSLEDVYSSTDGAAMQENNVSYTGSAPTTNQLHAPGANSIQSSACDTLANCVHSSNSDWDKNREFVDSLASSESLLCLLQGDFGIWSSVLESVASHPSPRQDIEADWPFSCLPFEDSGPKDPFYASSFLLDSGNPWSSVWLPISPRREEDQELCSRPTSRLWDVNLHSPRERCSTIENIQHYLMNLRFSGSSPFHSSSSAVGGPVTSLLCKSPAAFISGGIYSIKLDWMSSIWELDASSLWDSQAVADKCRHSALDLNRHSILEASLASNDSPTLVHLSPPLDDLDANVWQNFSPKSRSIHQYSSSLENLVEIGHERGTRGQRSPVGGKRLEPSENSAFRDVIPPRLPHLPHVQSDPALSLNYSLRHRQYQQLDCNGRKLVQVKSVYKSDNSVLSQLGLTSKTIVPLQCEEFRSPEKYTFIPIKVTPVVSRTKEKKSDSPQSVYIGRTSGYQWYRDIETSSTACTESFIPRFKVNKGTEKKIQTGESIEEVEEEEFSTDDESQGGERNNSLGRLLSDMQDVLLLETDEDTERLVLETMEEYEAGASPLPPPRVPSLEGNIAELWEGQVSEEEKDSKAAADEKVSYQSIWTFGEEPAALNPVLGGAVQEDQVQIFNLHQAPMDVVLVACSSDEDDGGSPSLAEGGEPLPFVKVNSRLAEAVHQAFLDNGLPGYIPEMCFGGPQNEENWIGSTEQEEDAWIENPQSDDDDDDVLRLIEIRKHYTTPTEDQSEAAIPAEQNSLHWSSFQEEQLMQWQRFQSTLSENLKSRWSDWDDEGNRLRSRPEDPAHGISHSLSVDRDLSSLWTSAVEGPGTLDDNDNPVSLEEHAQSWPRHHSFFGIHGNKHWLSRPEEIISYPNDWIVDDSQDTSTHSLLQCETDSDLVLNDNNNSKLFHEGTKHWSLGDQSEEESFTNQVKRQLSLQDSDLFKRRAHFNPNDSRDNLEALWINPTSLGFNDGFSTELNSKGSASLTGATTLSSVLPEVDDVFCSEEASDDSPEEVFTCGEGPPPKEHAVYSDQLEQSWMNESHFRVQVPRKVHRSKLEPSQKACSYFMEGSCRRTDCKFSHDTSSITCRFWEESSCFKGVTCPFLHGYPSVSAEFSEQSSSCDLESDFLLEDEEFPTLAKYDDDDIEPHPAQRAAEMRRSEQRDADDKHRVTFLAYRRKEPPNPEAPGGPDPATAPQVDQDNEKVI